MSKGSVDLLSPSFIGGFAGMAVHGDVAGFIIGAGGTWAFLFTLLVIGTAIAARGGAARTLPPSSSLHS